MTHSSDISRHTVGLGLLVVSILCLAAYANTFSAPFTFDDSQNILEESAIRLTHLDFGGLGRAAFESTGSNRPLANATFALNYYFGGYQVFGYHLVNLALHLMNGMLVFVLASTLLRAGLPEPQRERAPLAALTATALFLLHPIQTQSVTYVVQRMNLLATLFYLAAILLYLRGRRVPGSVERWGAFMGCGVAGVLALAGKEIAATLPAALLLCEWLLFGGRGWRGLRRALPYLALPACFAIGALLLMAGLDPIRIVVESYADRDFTPLERLLTEPRVIWFYLSLLVLPLPSRLNLLHPFEISHSLGDPGTTLLAVLGLVGCLALGISLAGRRPLVSFCIYWFLLQLAIESSLIGLDILFEHRLYLPSIGLFVLAGYLLFAFLSERRALAIAIAASLLLAGATHFRNDVWGDAVTLWRDVVRKNPNSHEAHNNLAHSLSEARRTDEAIVEYREALRLEPESHRSHANIAHLLEQTGQGEEALAHLREALRIAPDSAEALSNFGVYADKRGRWGEAEASYRRATEADPRFAEGHNNLGWVLAEQGQLAEAEAEYREALRLDPGLAGTYNNLGLVLARQGRYDEASASYLRAIELDSEDAAAHNNLGLVHAAEGRHGDAIQRYLEALRVDPVFAKAHNNLGVALARTGRLPEAIREFSEALRIDPDYREAELNLEQARSLSHLPQQSP